MKTKLIPKHQQPSLPLFPGLEGFVYKGPTYLEVQKQIDPITRNLIAINVARRNNPTREIVIYKDNDGNIKTTTNVQAGALSPVDPVGEFVVAGAAMNKPLEAAGKGLLYGVGRFGSGKALNWARGKILSGAMNKNMTGMVPYEVLGDRTPYGLYRVQQPNGTIRLRLPEHTSAKPREIKIDPKKGEGHNIHMRTWDDPVNHIPASISSLDKLLLFNGLTEELPEGTVINIPESSSDFLGTRGTIAGIKHLERSPMFRVGDLTGVVLYLGKNGVESYPTTNFIRVTPNSNFDLAFTPITQEQALEILLNSRMNFISRAIAKGYRGPLLKMRIVRTPEDAYLNLYLKSPKTPEEFAILDNYKKFYEGGGANIGHNGRLVVMLNPKHPLKDVVANHEIAHYLLNPRLKAPTSDIFDYELAESTFPKRAKGYFSSRGGTELTSRGTLIHDWLGHSGTEPITTQELLDASLNYIKTTGVDNVMSEFFKGIKDYDKMSKWLSENAIQYGLPITLGVSTYRMSKE